MPLFLRRTSYGVREQSRRANSWRLSASGLSMDFGYGAGFPGPPTACNRGIRSFTGGSAGNAACGSVWYQYATEKKLSDR
jgi:hypothetical protein